MRKNYARLTTTISWPLFVLALLCAGAIPHFADFGLNNPEPIGPYLNLAFPSSAEVGPPYKRVFPNITFDSPLTFQQHPRDSKLIVGQRDGKIYWFDHTPDVAQKNLLLDLSGEVGVVWDGGFLGLALHPKFGTSGFNYFYTYYTTKDANGNNFPDGPLAMGCDNEEYFGNFLVLARFETRPGSLEVIPDSKQVLLKLRMYGSTHRGGGLLFGQDNFLYLSTGEQAAGQKAQDIVNNLDGGVLRIDVDQDPRRSHAPVRTMPDDHGYSDEISGNGYWIPNDNPFLNPTGQNFEEYYSMGHRNPHRMTMDRATGTIYIGEVGAGTHEEVNVLQKGKNYGWPRYEGLVLKKGCVPGLYNNMPHQSPLVAFPRSEANALIGGFVYRGSQVPELTGKYLCADYGIGEEIWAVDPSSGAYQQLGNFTSTNIISFGEDNDGELYIMKLGAGGLYKLVSNTLSTTEIPRYLSMTGAFDDLATLTPRDGLIEYDMIESFWSDGALKKRWLAIPNDGQHDTAEEKIKFSENGVWDFPVGSVLVKHFEMPIDEGNPRRTKRLETRFSIKGEDGNFYFATYKWNDAQNDAVLLMTGQDETINIAQLNGGTRAQTWRYPSTSECTSCHNQASGGTLGPRTRNLNKSITYAKTGVSANQLVTLSHLEILDRDIRESDVSTFLTHKSPDNPNATLDEKARSYLDLNCAYCHQPGTGNRGAFDLRLSMSLAETGLLTARPNTSLGLPDEKILSPGKPASSLLYHRLNSTESGIAMPPVTKNTIDDRGVALVKQWIEGLNQTPPPSPTSPSIAPGIYTITSKSSGKSVDIAEASFDNKANVLQWEYKWDRHQQFSIEQDKDSYYRMRARHSSK